jgi:hypothetical protein
MYVHAKEFRQSIPSLAHLIYEELVGWYQLFDALRVVKKLLLSVCEQATSMILPYM